MPFVKLQISKPLESGKEETILKSASKILSSTMGKPEAYTMAMLEKTEACMAGKMSSSAFVDIRGIGGFSREINGKISQQFCHLLEKEAGIPPENTYLTFTDVAPENWGWKGTTFG